MTELREFDEPASYSERVGERVHQVMWRQKRKQGEVATLLDMAQATLSRKIRGTRPWEVGELAAIAEVLGVPITDLLPSQEDPRPDDPDEGSGAPSRARTEDLRIIRSDAWCELAVAS
jgi:transcriptional regulator with XRE-family HTH domain